MEDYVNFINKKFQDFFLDYINKNNIHPIMKDLYKNVIKIEKKNIIYYDNIFKKIKINISKLKKLKKYKIKNNKRNIISLEMLKDKFFKDKNYYNFNINNEKLEKIAKYFQNSYMPGTIKKLSDHKYESDRVNVVIYGSGPVGLFTIFEAGMLKIKCHIVDTLEVIGGQCSALYPEKPIYDIPACPKILASELIERLEAQAEPFDPVYHLNQRVEKLIQNVKERN
jgi:hypothetical protein